MTDEEKALALAREYLANPVAWRAAGADTWYRPRDGARVTGFAIYMAQQEDD